MKMNTIGIIEWHYGEEPYIRKFKKGDQLRTSEGTFEFDESRGWVKQEVTGRPSTFGHVLKLPGDSLYLFIGPDGRCFPFSPKPAAFKDPEEHSCDEHVCSCKCEGRCKDAKKNETSKKDDALAKTVDGMLSDDYKERFIAEYVQLLVRLTRLDTFIQKILMGRSVEKMMHDCPIDLLIKQREEMAEYLDILKKRARIEKINLPEHVA